MTSTQKFRLAEGGVYSEAQAAYMASGHTWKLEMSSPYIDSKAWTWGEHYGPECTSCLVSFCMHCSSDPPPCSRQKAMSNSACVCSHPYGHHDESGCKRSLCKCERFMSSHRAPIKTSQLHSEDLVFKKLRQPCKVCGKDCKWILCKKCKNLLEDVNVNLDIQIARNDRTIQRLAVDMFIEEARRICRTLIVETSASPHAARIRAEEEAYFNIFGMQIEYKDFKNDKD